MPADRRFWTSKFFQRSRTRRAFCAAFFVGKDEGNASSSEQKAQTYDNGISQQSHSGAILPRSETVNSMRLSANVNGTARLVAAVNGPGYLSAHLNVHARPKDRDESKTLQLSGIQTLDTETIHLHWPKVDLQTGDSVEIRLLEDGEGDVPSEVRCSSESPRNLFSRPELAQELLALVSDFDSHLMKLVEKSEQTELPEEHKRFTAAVGRVVYEVGESFLYPIYRRHKQFVPADLRGELL